MPLEEDIQYGTVFVNGSPHPQPGAFHPDAAENPSAFSAAQILDKLIAEIETTGMDRFSGNLDATLEKQLLDAPVTQGIAVMEPDGMADDQQRKSLAGQLLVDQHLGTLPQ